MGGRDTTRATRSGASRENRPAMPPPSSALPSSFTSLYRLFLRTASASVLHHPPAVRHIRRLWRPFFEDGAQAAHLLARSDGASPEFMRVRQWYNTFEQRSTPPCSSVYPSLCLFRSHEPYRVQWTTRLRSSSMQPGRVGSRTHSRSNSPCFGARTYSGSGSITTACSAHGTRRSRASHRSTRPRGGGA